MARARRVWLERLKLTDSFYPATLAIGRMTLFWALQWAAAKAMVASPEG